MRAKFRAYWLLEIADSYKDEGNYLSAETYYLQAIEACRECGSVYKEQFNQLELADNYILRGRIEKGMGICQNILGTVTETTSNLIPMNAECILASGFMAQDSCQRAIQHFKRSSQLFRSTASGFSADDLRIGFIDINLSNLRKISQCYFRLYQQSGNPQYLDSLFTFEEQQRALVLKDRIQNRRTLAAQVRALKNDSLYQKSCQDISSIQSRLRKQAGNDTASILPLLKDLEEAKLTLLMHRADAQSRIDSKNSKPLTETDDTRKLMAFLEETDRGLLCYHISREQSFVLAVTGEQINAFQLPADELQIRLSVDSLLQPFHKVDSIGIDSLAFHACSAHKLYKYLIQPVTDHMQLPENLLILRDAPLYQLPFDMLLTRISNKTVYYPKDVPEYASDFLQTHYSISYCPSALLLTQKPKCRKKSILVMANPTADAVRETIVQQRLRSQLNWVFGSLPFAELESKSISRFFPKEKVLQRHSATEQMICELAPEYDILHFATHAFADTVFEAFSGVLLAEEDTSANDGILMGYEIENLPLECDLVTLSACETGMGKVVRGEGIMSLPREFLYAGAQSVLMSFWKVDDEFTSRLMPKFYELYRQGDSKSMALTETKRFFLQSKPQASGYYDQHPFFWASFSIYGHPGESNPAARWPLCLLGILVLIPAAVFLWKKIR